MKELVFIQSKLKAPKNQYNAFGKYKYRNAEGILEAVKPLLAQQECTLILNDDVVAVGERIYVKAVATLTNKDGQSISAQAFSREEEAKKGMDASQITGTASSYARKYALNGLFAIDDTKDADYLNTSADYTQESDPVLATALQGIAEAKTREDLMKVWNANKDLQSNKKFLDACTNRGKEVTK